MEGPPTRRFPSPLASHVEQEREIEAVRNASFPAAIRGYDRGSVDAYVERVNRLIAELEISRSPESAVKHAVAQVSEETRGILDQAHQAAEEITTRSRARASERLDQAEAEATEIREAAEARVRELDADAEAIWHERLRLIEDVREVAHRLLAVADEASARFPAVHPEDETQALPADAAEPLAPVDELFDGEAVKTAAAPDEPVDAAEPDAPPEGDLAPEADAELGSVDSDEEAAAGDAEAGDELVEPSADEGERRPDDA